MYSYFDYIKIEYYFFARLLEIKKNYCGSKA